MRFFQHKWPAILLWPLSLLYSAIISLRNMFYNWGLLKSYKVPCTVISVGNITVGGTGKTPTVMTLARALAPKRVCIVSRGYGRKSSGNVIVSDYNSVLVPVTQSGDEPRMLAQSLPGVPVIVDRDRVNGARVAIAQFNPDVILLDDGFQHRRLHRDVDIVTMNGEQPFGNGMVLPAGPLREPLGNLNRASAFWVNGGKNIPARIERYTKPIFQAEYKPDGLYTLPGEFVQSGLQGLKVAAFTGLGNPESFRRTILGMGADLKMFIPYKDHHNYTRQDMERLTSLFHKHDIDWIITTAKDVVKLSGLTPGRGNWGYIKISITPNDQARFVTWLKSVSL